MDVWSPAILIRGRPVRVPAAAEEPIWVPPKYTFAGIWEIDPLGLEEHAEAVQILDVREPGEFEGPLGHIRGARLIPLGDLAERARAIGRDRPILAVCRARTPSAHAPLLLPP